MIRIKCLGFDAGEARRRSASSLGVVYATLQLLFTSRRLR
jgi:hypothetical protein